MNESAKYFEESLYPLQDGILKAVAETATSFYLTGGTLLSRELLGHRYSDDIGLFVNADPFYRSEAERLYGVLVESGVAEGWACDEGESAFSSEYSRIVVVRGAVRLKLDLVNDIPYRWGDVGSGRIFPRVDTVKNMLSNKLTALYRYEAKDIADIWAISRTRRFRWQDVFQSALQKEEGVDPLIASDIVAGFPREYFDRIKWRVRPDPDLFFTDLGRIARDLVEVGPNHLCMDPEQPEL